MNRKFELNIRQQHDCRQRPEDQWDMLILKDKDSWWLEQFRAAIFAFTIKIEKITHCPWCKKELL